jgi:chromatin modification-related protein VID21
MAMPSDPLRRFYETPWSDSEDRILKRIVERYPNNWALIADVFNSSRVTISTDKRTSWDCLARWDARWNDGKALAANTESGAPGASGDVEMLETASLTGSAPPTPVRGASMANGQRLQLHILEQGAESRKRRRHIHMYDAMRKSAKMREDSMKAIGKYTIFNEFERFIEMFTF